MENKLPNPEDILNSKEFDPDKGINFEEYHGDTIFYTCIAAMEEYGKQVRDYTLEVASENAECELGAIIDMGFEIISASVNKDSILNLKNSKELEI